MKILFILTLLISLSSFASENSPSSSVGGVDHIGLTVLDLAATQTFFEDTLGFKVVGGDKSYPSVFVSNGKIRITLWQVKNSQEAVPFNRKNNVGLHHLALSVESLDKLHGLHEKLKKSPGVKIEFSPEHMGKGPHWHMMIREPSGNRLEFTYRAE